ncbi:MAG: hypothetical protein K2W99_01010 [Chthoniobacterales bacterium]|nr:hypothetical protein [Chthoniobacterales bacterium]
MSLKLPTCRWQLGDGSRGLLLQARNIKKLIFKFAEGLNSYLLSSTTNVFLEVGSYSSLKNHHIASSLHASQ